MACWHISKNFVTNDQHFNKIHLKTNMMNFLTMKWRFYLQILQNCLLMKIIFHILCREAVLKQIKWENKCWKSIPVNMPNADLCISLHCKKKWQWIHRQMARKKFMTFEAVHGFKERIYDSFQIVAIFKTELASLIIWIPNQIKANHSSYNSPHAIRSNNLKDRVIFPFLPSIDLP